MLLSETGEAVRRLPDGAGQGPSRIAIVSSQAFSVINFRGPLIRALVASGAEVYALAPDYEDDTEAEVARLGAVPVPYSLSRAGMNPIRDGLDMIRLIGTLRRLRPSITLAYFIKPVIYGTLASWLSGIGHRFVLIEGLGYVFGDSESDGARSRSTLKMGVTLLYRFALRRAHKVFLLNPDDRDELLRLGVVESDKVVMLDGIGVDLVEWQAEAPPSAPIAFILAARLLREKGILEYVSAARRVKKAHPETRFILLGGLDPNPSGLGRGEVEAWVDEGLLEWPGHVDVKSWLVQSSVYVLPSFYREGLPRSIQEAMAMGRPIITTEAPGCRETVEEGRNGFLVPVRDVEALTEAMLRFIEQPELIARMGAESRKMAQERFDVHKVNRIILDAMGISPGRAVDA